MDRAGKTTPCRGSLMSAFAQSGHQGLADPCPLLGVKRTSPQFALMSAFDLNRTFVALLRFMGQRLTKMLTINCAALVRVGAPATAPARPRLDALERNRLYFVPLTAVR